jgi:hypothetical protein
MNTKFVHPRDTLFDLLDELEVILKKYGIKDARMYQIGKSANYMLVLIDDNTEPCFRFANWAKDQCEKSERFRGWFPGPARVALFAEVINNTDFNIWLSKFNDERRYGKHTLVDLLWFPLRWRDQTVATTLESLYLTDRAKLVRSLFNAPYLAVFKTDS